MNIVGFVIVVFVIVRMSLIFFCPYDNVHFPDEIKYDGKIFKLSKSCEVKPFFKYASYFTNSIEHLFITQHRKFDFDHFFYTSKVISIKYNEKVRKYSVEEFYMEIL